jgi:hypothetical protein
MRHLDAGAASSDDQFHFLTLEMDPVKNRYYLKKYVVNMDVKDSELKSQGNLKQTRSLIKEYASK